MDPDKSLTFSELVWDIIDAVFEWLDGPSRFVFTFVNQSYRNRYQFLLRPQYAGFSSPMVSEYFARNGYLALVQWAYGFLNGTPMMSPGMPNRAATTAALMGHMDVLRWLDSRGKPMTKALIHAAAEGGHIEIIKWLVNDKGVPLPRSSPGMAAFSGKVEVVKALIEMGAPFAEFTVNNSVHSGNLELVKYVFEIFGYPTSGEDGDLMLRAACHSKSVEVFNYLYELGFPCSARGIFVDACKGANVSIMKKVVSMGCFDLNIHKNSLQDLARNGTIEAFDYALSLGLPLTEAVTREVASKNSYEVLRYIIDRGAPVMKDLPEIVLKAKKPTSWDSLNSAGLTLDQLEFLWRHGAEINEATFRTAIRVGNFKVAFWLIEKGIGTFDREAFNVICGSGTVKVIEVGMKQFGFEFDDVALQRATCALNSPVLKWATLNPHKTTFTDPTAAISLLAITKPESSTDWLTMGPTIRALHQLGASLTEEDFLSSIPNRYYALWSYYWDHGCRPSKEKFEPFFLMLQGPGRQSPLNWFIARGLKDYLPNADDDTDRYDRDSDSHEFDDYHEYFYPTPEQPRREAPLPMYQIYEMENRQIPIDHRLAGIVAPRAPRGRGVPARGGFRGIPVPPGAVIRGRGRAGGGRAGRGGRGQQ